MKRAESGGRTAIVGVGQSSLEFAPDVDSVRSVMTEQLWTEKQFREVEASMREREERLERLAQCTKGHDTRHFHGWLHEIQTLIISLRDAQQQLYEAAREINCAGPVAHRIRVLKQEHEEEMRKMQVAIDLADKAFELDKAVSIQGTGGLNALQVVKKLSDLATRVITLEDAIRSHRAQKADDRCIEDDDLLYEALGDGIKCDRRVGDKAEMLRNCERFINNRCEGGGWPTYIELEAEVTRLRGVEEGNNG